ncbi:nectin-2 [Chanos chanos]|uniref:Nectin-2 n=1 Tax=Chanos chanos TaxID=29144 RepID=A0A6J2W8E1_CHACN|nr:nectin-2 [Chanos chanos]
MIGVNCPNRLRKMILVWSLGLLLTIQGVTAQRVKVEPEVMSYPGEAVNLRCQFPNSADTRLTQVTWILEPTDGERTNIAVFHPTFGVNYPASPVAGRVTFTQSPPSLENPSIQIRDVKMTDEGRYICEYATYPSGTEQGVTNLIMLAKPKNSASAVTVVAGTATVVVARCESANGRPASTLTWVTSVSGNGTTPVKTMNADNTVTVKSEYRLVPTPKDNGKEVSCVVRHRTQKQPESFPMKLSIEYPPVVKISGYDNNWYVGRTNVLLTCEAQSNPFPTTVVWKTLTGVIPETVQIKENKLTVLKVDESVNTTFICEVKNRLGIGKDQVTANVREPPTVQSNAGVVAGAVIGSLLALLLVGAIIGVLVTHHRRQQQGGYRGNGKSHGSAYDIKARLFGPSKNGTNGGGGVGNNNGPIYTYRDGPEAGLTEKSNHGLQQHQGGVALLSTTPTAQDILLSGEMDEAERRKFDEVEMEEDERYDHFDRAGPILQLRPHNEDLTGSYIDDDMESQRDGSVISRTAVYV